MNNFKKQTKDKFFPIPTNKNFDKAKTIISRNIQKINNYYSPAQKAFIGVYYFYDDIEKSIANPRANLRVANKIKEFLHVPTNYITLVRLIMNEFSTSQRKHIMKELFPLVQESVPEIKYKYIATSPNRIKVYDKYLETGSIISAFEIVSSTISYRTSKPSVKTVAISPEQILPAIDNNTNTYQTVSVNPTKISHKVTKKFVPDVNTNGADVSFTINNYNSLTKDQQEELHTKICEIAKEFNLDAEMNITTKRLLMNYK